MIAFIVLASSASELFIFSPDIGLHMEPVIHNVHDKVRGPTYSIPTQGIIVQDELVSPALGGQKRPFLVYLPPSYNTPTGRTKRYSTLYLLHGSPGNDSDWFTGGKADQSADTLISLGKIPELILILPDGNGRPGQTSEWGNAFDHHQNIETYIAVDLVKYVDANYRTIADAEHRGIGGLSMGGFGAINIALHHPNIFGTVISLGGYYRAEGSIWGRNAAYIRMNSPIDVLPTDKSAWRLHLYIGAATKDQPYYTDARQSPGNLWTNWSSCINRISSMCRTGITRGGSGKCKSIMLCSGSIGVQVDVTVFMIEAVAHSLVKKRDGSSSSKAIGTKEGKGAPRKNDCPARLSQRFLPRYVHPWLPQIVC